MSLIEWLFWIFASIIFYSYIGYGLLLWLIIRTRAMFKKSDNKQDEFFYPQVSLIIPAFNEEDFIRQKIGNTISLDYPAEKLQIIFSTDGSTDSTPSIIKEYPGFQLLHTNERKGKISAINRAMKTITNPYVIFCDANTLLNKDAIKEIIKHYQDPKVGAVSGEKKVISESDNNTAGKGESLYWKYESSLKRLDSDFYTVVGAAGELFSIRTELFDEVEEDTLLDDFMISLRICQKGYRVIYEPRAFAMEKPSSNLKEEQKRKVRISAGAFQSMWRLKNLLNPFPHPKLSFQYISHRVLRWALCPFLLPVLLFLNFFILRQNESVFIYQFIFILQLIFYVMAFLGWFLSKSGRSAKLLNFPYYFVFMNISLYMGLKKFLSGGQSVLWEKAKRNA